MRLPLVLVLALACSAAHRADAAASYDACTGFIDTLPATIGTQGTWCLRNNLTSSLASGAAISIATNNVVLDCNGFKIGGLSAGPTTQAVGVAAAARQNAVVRGCNLRGFHTGIHLAGAGHVVEDNLLEASTALGIQVEGDGSVVRRNRVLDSGLPAAVTAYGIATLFRVDVVDNTVDGVSSAQFGYGIHTMMGDTAVIAGNHVRGVVSVVTYGIYEPMASRIVVRGNVVNGPGSLGIRCDNASASSMDNVVAGFATGVANCTQSGDLVNPF